MTTSLRPPLDEDLRPPLDEDLRVVYEIVAADDCNELGKPDVDESDVTEWWSMPHHDKASDAWILERNGAPAGYAFTHDRSQVGRFDTNVWLVDEADEQGFDLLLTAAIARTTQLARDNGNDQAEVSTWSVMGRERRASWLMARGFATVRRFYRMEVHLEQALPPQLDIDVTIEPLGSDETARRTFQHVMSEAFVGHWGYVAIDYETWLARVTASPHLDWDTIWLARVNGQPAAGLKMRLYDDIAFIDTVGTLQDFRGRGLASSLLRTAFADALRRGQAHVELGVDTENDTGAVKVYEKAGMSVAFAHDEWKRQLV